MADNNIEVMEEAVAAEKTIENIIEEVAAESAAEVVAEAVFEKTPEQLAREAEALEKARKAKIAATWDKITTGLLILLMASPFLILLYIFLWFMG